MTKSLLMERLSAKTLSIEKLREGGRLWSRESGNPTSRTSKAGDAESFGTGRAEREEAVTRLADRSSTPNQRGIKRFTGFRAGGLPASTVGEAGKGNVVGLQGIERPPWAPLRGFARISSRRKGAVAVACGGGKNGGALWGRTEKGA